MLIRAKLVTEGSLAALVDRLLLNEVKSHPESAAILAAELERAAQEAASKSKGTPSLWMSNRMSEANTRRT